MSDYTFPSSIHHPDGDTPTGLLDQLRRLGDLYGPAGVTAAAAQVQDELRLGGSTGILDRPRTLVVGIECYSAVIAAASKFAEQLVITAEAGEVAAVIRHLRDACTAVLEHSGEL